MFGHNFIGLDFIQSALLHYCKARYYWLIVAVKLATNDG